MTINKCKCGHVPKIIQYKNNGFPIQVGLLCKCCKGEVISNSYTGIFFTKEECATILVKIWNEERCMV